MELLLVRAESGNISDHDFGTEYARLGDELDLANANAPEGRPTF